MQVKKIIEILSKEYNEDDYLMIDWFDKDCLSVTSNELWIECCEKSLEEDYLMNIEIAQIIVRKTADRLKGKEIE